MTRYYLYSILFSFAVGFIANIIHKPTLNGVTTHKSAYQEFRFSNISIIYLIPIVNVISATILFVVAILKRSGRTQILNKVLDAGMEKIKGK